PGPAGEDTKARATPARTPCHQRWRMVSPPVFTDQDRPEIPPGGVWRQERLGTVAVYEVRSAGDDLDEVKVRRAPGLEAGRGVQRQKSEVGSSWMMQDAHGTVTISEPPGRRLRHRLVRATSGSASRCRVWVRITQS